MNWNQIIEFLDNSWVTPAGLLLLGILSWIKSSRKISKSITHYDDEHLPR